MRERPRIKIKMTKFFQQKFLTWKFKTLVGTSLKLRLLIWLLAIHRLKTGLQRKNLSSDSKDIFWKMLPETGLKKSNTIKEKLQISRDALINWSRDTNKILVTSQMKKSTGTKILRNLLEKFMTNWRLLQVMDLLQKSMMSRRKKES